MNNQNFENRNEHEREEMLNNMNNQGYQSNRYQYATKQQNTFKMLSLVFGLLAFFSCMFVVTTFIFGGLSVIFAILSKTSTERFSSSAIGGIASSIAGMVCVFVLMIYSYILITTPEYREILNKTYEQMYGQSFDELLEDAQNGTLDPYSLQPK